MRLSLQARCGGHSTIYSFGDTDFVAALQYVQADQAAIFTGGVDITLCVFSCSEANLEGLTITTTGCTM